MIATPGGGDMPSTTGIPPVIKQAIDCIVAGSWAPSACLPGRCDSRDADGLLVKGVTLQPITEGAMPIRRSSFPR